jgi:hypothetical protein
MLLALFPFTVMFLVTSVAMLRERSTGTLERLLATSSAPRPLRPKRPHGRCSYADSPTCSRSRMPLMRSAAPPARAPGRQRSISTSPSSPPASHSPLRSAPQPSADARNRSRSAASR